MTEQLKMGGFCASVNVSNKNEFSLYQVVRIRCLQDKIKCVKK